MRQAGIIGLGQVSAAGAGVAALRTALQGQQPAAEWLPLWPDSDEKVPVFCARASGIERFVNPRLLRRVDAFSQRALLAAFLAFEDAGMQVAEPTRIGIALATGYGPLATSFAFLEDVIDKGDNLGSPILFSNSVHNAPTSQISAALGIEGPTITVTGFAHAFTRALSLGMDWLAAGEVDYVLVGSADEYHPVLGYGVASLGGRSSDGHLRPLQFEDCSYVAGETFTALLLGPVASARHAIIEKPAIFQGSLPQDEVPLFLSAQGSASEGAGYLAAARQGSEVAAYSSLWGASPTAEAMTLVAAALSLSDEIFYPVPSTASASHGLRLLQAGPLGSRRALRCLTLSGPSGGNSLLLRHI